MLSSMNTDAMCERLKQMDGIDPNMLSQYTSTIKKVHLLITFKMYPFLKKQDFFFFLILNIILAENITLTVFRHFADI